VVRLDAISTAFDPMESKHCWGFPSIAALVHLLGAHVTVTLVRETQAMIIAPGLRAVFSTGVHGTVEIFTPHDGVNYVERCLELVKDLKAVVTSRVIPFLFQLSRPCKCCLLSSYHSSHHLPDITNHPHTAGGVTLAVCRPRSIPTTGTSHPLE
jgi:hypothetical protein